MNVGSSVGFQAWLAPYFVVILLHYNHTKNDGNTTSVFARRKARKPCKKWVSDPSELRDQTAVENQDSVLPAGRLDLFL